MNRHHQFFVFMFLRTDCCSEDRCRISSMQQWNVFWRASAVSSNCYSSPPNALSTHHCSRPYHCIRWPYWRFVADLWHYLPWRWPACMDNINNIIGLFLQGKSHVTAVENLHTLYWPILKANWSYLSLFVFVNIKYVPPMVSLSRAWFQIVLPRTNWMKFSSCLLLAVARAGRQSDRLRLGDFPSEQTPKVGWENERHQIQSAIDIRENWIGNWPANAAVASDFNDRSSFFYRRWKDILYSGIIVKKMVHF